MRHGLAVLTDDLAPVERYLSIAQSAATGN